MVSPDSGKLGTIGYGRTVTIPVEMLPQDGTITVTYTDATVQPNADTVDIIGEFRTRSGASQRRAGRIEAEIRNVADGSGIATITTGRSPRYTVKAGSVDNDITVKFTAAGTMNGGRVTLERPEGWGNMQDSDADEPNYVTVTPGGRNAALRRVDVGRDLISAQIDSLGPKGTITFMINDAEASPDLGISEFIIESAGSRSGDLISLVGESKEPDDGNLVTGKIHWVENGTNDVFDATDERNGILRIKIDGAADGTGTAEVEVRGSDHSGKYDGSSTATREVHAGSTGSYLLFTYSPTQTIIDGELRFTVPSDWSAPQGEEQGEEGYTYLDEVGNADIGPAVFNGRTITAEIIEVTKQDAIQIHYGWHGAGEGNAVAPKVAKSSAFGIQIKGSDSGSPDSIRTPAHSESQGASKWRRNCRNFPDNCHCGKYGDHHHHLHRCR